MGYMIEPFISGPQDGIPCSNFNGACEIADAMYEARGQEYAVFGADRDLLYVAGKRRGMYTDRSGDQ